MATTPVVPGRLESGSAVKVPDGKGGEKDAAIVARYEVYDLASDAIKAGLADGSILADENATVKIGDDYVVFTELTAVTLTAMQALCKGPVDLVLDESGSQKKG